MAHVIAMLCTNKRASPAGPLPLRLVIIRNRRYHAHARPPSSSLWCRRSCVCLAFTLAFAGSGVAADSDTSALALSNPSVVRIADPTRSPNQLKRLETVVVVTPHAFYDETELTLCRTRPQRFCRDLAKAEFEVTSLHGLVPTVPGLAAKSITFRHNAVIANYTFR